jgi:hypothetical protein
MEAPPAGNTGGKPAGISSSYNQQNVVRRLYGVYLGFLIFGLNLFFQDSSADQFCPGPKCMLLEKFLDLLFIPALALTGLIVFRAKNNSHFTVSVDVEGS